MLIPFIVLIALMLVLIGTSVPPMGLLGLAALIAAVGILLHACVALEKLKLRKINHEPDLRHSQ